MVGLHEGDRDEAVWTVKEWRVSCVGMGLLRANVNTERQGNGIPEGTPRAEKQWPVLQVSCASSRASI